MENLVLNSAVETQMANLNGRRISPKVLNALADVQDDFKSSINYGEYPAMKSRATDLTYDKEFEVITISTRTILIGHGVVSEIAIKISEAGILFVETRLGKIYEHQTLALNNNEFDDVINLLITMNISLKQESAYLIWKNISAAHTIWNTPLSAFKSAI